MMNYLTGDYCTVCPMFFGSTVNLNLNVSREIFASEYNLRFLRERFITPFTRMFYDLSARESFILTPHNKKVFYHNYPVIERFIIL